MEPRFSTVLVVTGFILLRKESSQVGIISRTPKT
jgi:hypothetical protein